MSVETESGSTNKDNDKQTIIQRIRQLLVARDTSDDDDEKLRLAKRKRLAAVSFLTVVLLAYLRYVKQRKGRNTNNASLASPLFSFLSLTPIVSSWWKGPDYKQSLQESPMSFLWNAARDGIIQQALIGSSTIFFQTKRTANGAATWNRTLLPANNESIKSGLLEALALGGCKDIRALPESIWSKLATPVVAALPFVYLAILYRMMKNQFGGEDISSRLKNGTRKLLEDNEMDRTTFADVAGLDSVVEDVSEVVSYLANPSIYRGLGARPPRGVLLYGPPGSGKTLLARAVAGEAGCDTFAACSGSDFVEMYVGRGASRVRSLFDKVRRDALTRRRLVSASSWWTSLIGLSSTDTASLSYPAVAIVFIDELDALAKSRSHDGVYGNDEREQTLNQLLTEMDGFSSASSNQKDGDSGNVIVIVIGASNRADVIDPAVLRRFDRQIYVGYPEAKGRKEILLVHARRIQCTCEPIDWEYLASDAVTGNFSGADLRNVVNEAALLAVREQCRAVGQSHLTHAARRISSMKNRISNNTVPSLPTIFSNID